MKVAAEILSIYRRVGRTTLKSISGGQFVNVSLDLVDDATATATVPNQGNWFTAVQIR